MWRRWRFSTAFPLEVRQRQLARAKMDDADAALDFVGGMLARAERGAQAREQRLDVRLEQTRLQAREETLHREQRADLLRAEPEARQLVARRAGRRLHEPVAAALAVPLDRRVHAVPHVLQIALEGGARHAELAQQLRDLHHALGLEHPMDLVEAFRTVHLIGAGDGSASFCGARHGAAAVVAKTCHRTRFVAPRSATVWPSSSQREPDRSRDALQSRVPLR
jgi:hypothetical protein